MSTEDWTNLEKALNKIERLNPKWKIDGTLGHVEGNESFTITYESPEGIHISLSTTPTEGYVTGSHFPQPIYASDISPLKETEHFRSWRQQQVAKIIQCGELGILNARPVNSSVRRTQKRDLFDESVWL